MTCALVFVAVPLAVGSFGGTSLAVPRAPAPSAAPSSPDSAGSAAPKTDMSRYATPSPSPSPSSTPAPDERPPAGIVTTEVTLSTVLAMYRKSVGIVTPAAKTTREAGTIAAYGETGSFVDVRSGDDYVDMLRLGPTTTRRGRYHGRNWFCNENGLTRFLSGVHPSESGSSSLLPSSMPDRSTEGLTLLGVVSKPVDAYVVQQHSPGGRFEWFFIDTTTGRLVRDEWGAADRRAAWTYDDFRTVDGATSAWHEHYTPIYKGNEVDVTTTELAHNVPVSAADLAVPSTRLPVEFPPDAKVVRLPARIDRDGAIIVRITIGGRGLDFQLDSGSDSIVIDDEVARQLRLQTFGRNTEAVAGPFEASDALVGEMHIGDLTMRNVYVQSLPFNYREAVQTKVVGLLGYDFLAGVVAKIDYVHGTVDAFDPRQFSTPAGQLFELNMALDDAVPMVGARINDDVGNNFIVDTGSPYVVVFSAFTKAHPDELQRIEYNVGKKMYYPLVFATGVGGLIALRPVIAKAFHFGAVGFDNFVIFDMFGSQDTFQGEDEDGLIGYKFLSYFDLYLDYKDSMLLLAPNTRLTSPINAGN